jgi:hypothetical protein
MRIGKVARALGTDSPTIRFYEETGILPAATSGRFAGRVGVDLKHEGRRFAMTGNDMIELARLAVGAGFESLWTNEDVGFDSFAMLSAISQHASRIRLGTAIVIVYSRSAMQVAMAAATLDELSGGRAILGLSIGHHPWNDLGHGIPIEKQRTRPPARVSCVHSESRERRALPPRRAPLGIAPARYLAEPQRLPRR